jgi:hypothetical protein
MRKKKILIAFAVILAMSLGLNIYHYGHKYIYQKGFQDGANMVSNSVAQQYQQTGKITMQNDGQTIVFEPVSPMPVTGNASTTIGVPSLQDGVDSMMQ